MQPVTRPRPTSPSPSPVPPPSSGVASRTGYDVVIVGARAAGAATAMLLARRGLRVLAVDRAASSDTDVLSTHLLARTGVTQLRRWGLLDRVRAAGAPVARTFEFHYGGRPVAIDLSGGADGDDGLYAPRRTVLDPILVDAAAACGAEVRYGVSVSDLLVDADGAVNGVELVADGIRTPVSASWVVGADGIRSVVARRVGAPVLHQERSAGAVMYGYWSGLADDTLVNHFDVPGLAGGVIPTNAGQACVWVAIEPERFAAEARGDIAAAYHRVLAEHPGMTRRLAPATFAGGLRAFPGVPGFLRQAHGPGWALVGDAGYFKDPVSAHGITDAFVGAELLSNALVDALGGAANPSAALEPYQSQRDELARLLMPPVARLATLQLTGDSAMAAFREMNVALHREAEVIDALDARSLQPA